ncbi:tripartite tricarboxylate transporter substrate binding protein [Pigmentiphaga sp. YJ18]|uniref:Bug family tripartite tricarboxylate transporter substrate binding protein n=1 Tax=Pigmentiphaga sp. YJ18 TaxID=3134907 RepID=UPI00310FE4FE
MRSIRRRRLAASIIPTALAATCAAVSGLPAQAAYPEKPIKLVVGFAAGGANDLVARVVAQEASRKIGRPIIIENMPGSNAEVASGAVARAAPDGYTLLLGSSGALGISPILKPRLSYRPASDFAPVAMLAKAPYVLITSTQSSFRSVKELAAASRKSRQGLTFASVGVGSVPHLATEWFDEAAGVKALHVPYKGASQSIVDIVGRQVDYGFTTIAVAAPTIRAGQTRALAISSAGRSPLMPEVPAISETLPGFEAVVWYGLFSPAGTPEAILRYLHEAFGQALDSERVRSEFATQGFDVFKLPRDAIKPYVEGDARNWGNVIRRAGIQID